MTSASWASDNISSASPLTSAASPLPSGWPFTLTLPRTKCT